MNKGTKIIYLNLAKSTFVNTDERILKTKFNVRSVVLRLGKARIFYFIHLVKLFFVLLIKGVRSHGFVTWFGDYHSFVMVLAARIIRKPTVIIAGGQEAVCYRDLGKGVYLKAIRGWCVKYALRNASLILPNHKSLIYHENYFYNSQNPHIDGITHYVKRLKGKIEVVPNGIDTARIKRDTSIKKQNNLIFTLANVYKKVDFINKGFDLFIETARRNPDLEFVLIRISKELKDWAELTYQISTIPNLTVYSNLCSDEALSGYFNRAKVYVQVSITEGMPVSLGEAMLCECVPVGSNVNGIPDAIGNNGVLLYERSVEKLEEAIRKALTLDTGAQSRTYTLENFSVERREKLLLQAVSSVLVMP